MKITFFLLVLTPMLLFARKEAEKVNPIYRISTEVDTSLNQNEAVFEFQFDGRYDDISDLQMQYSIDGVSGSQVLKNRTLVIRTTPGKHIFQFYYNEMYDEVYTDSLAIKNQCYDSYIVTLFRHHFIDRNDRNLTEKPVIYLYPQKSTKVRVQMDIHGDDIFTYPTLNEAWEFTANPNGDLLFGDKTYNYLFWEASMPISHKTKQTASGFFVEGKDAITFLEEKLTQAGLNTKEQADFITYWGPRLAKNELNFVHFEFNAECNVYANIEISPKPNTIYRIYMIWSDVPERFKAEEQKIEKVDRNGFLVLEWGGKETHFKQSN